MFTRMLIKSLTTKQQLLSCTHNEIWSNAIRLMFQLIFTERPRWRLIDRNYINPVIFHHESSSSLRSLPWSSFCHLRKTRDSPRVKKQEDLCCGSRVNGTSERDESKTRLTWRTVCVISDEKSEKFKWKKSHFGWLTRRSSSPMSAEEKENFAHLANNNDVMIISMGRKI